jgi:hypothetical protein
MITKKTIGPITFTIVDDESELWQIEEPPEPIITVTYDGGSWVVYGDDNAEHEDFGEKWWPAVMYGGAQYEQEAKDYGKRWAKAVRGSYEII